VKLLPVLALVLAVPAADSAAPPKVWAQTAAAPAPRILASVILSGNEAFGSADLVEWGKDRLILEKKNRLGQRIERSELGSLQSLLAILGDKRLAVFWPLILERTGPDLVRSRDVLLARTAVGLRTEEPQLLPDDAAEAELIGSRTVAWLQRLNAMEEAGRLDDGIVEAQAEIARAAEGDSLRDAYAEFALRARMSSLLAANDRPYQALRMFVDGEARLRKPRFLLDYWVNRAALLADMGRYADALALMDRLIARARLMETFGNSRLHFAWIRACALKGLGRTREAGDEYVHARNSGRDMAQARLRAMVCMRDEDGLARELVRQLTGSIVPADAALLLQSAWRGSSRHRAMYARALARADVRAAFDARARLLPSEMEPALRHWAP
jgi:tetratricopeptide (TPR) repeat protein